MNTNVTLELELNAPSLQASICPPPCLSVNERSYIRMCMPIQRGSETISESSALRTLVSRECATMHFAGTVSGSLA